MGIVKTFFPSSFPQATGFAALVKTLAPAAVHMTYCANNALPYRVEWDSPRGPARFFGLSPDAAAMEALTALSKCTVLPPATFQAITEPSGNSDWAEAMRDLIADMEPPRPTRMRPVLRVVRSTDA